jgi:hypothetical protein
MRNQGTIQYSLTPKGGFAVDDNFTKHKINEDKSPFTLQGSSSS